MSEQLRKESANIKSRINSIADDATRESLIRSLAADSNIHGGLTRQVNGLRSLLASNNPEVIGRVKTALNRELNASKQAEAKAQRQNKLIKAQDELIVDTAKEGKKIKGKDERVLRGLGDLIAELGGVPQEKGTVVPQILIDSDPTARPEQPTAGLEEFSLFGQSRKGQRPSQPKINTNDPLVNYQAVQAKLKSQLAKGIITSDEALNSALDAIEVAEEEVNRQLQEFLNRPSTTAIQKKLAQKRATEVLAVLRESV